MPIDQKHCHRCKKPVTYETSFENGAPAPGIPGPRMCYECGTIHMGISSPEDYMQARGAGEAYFAERDRPPEAA